MVIGNGMLATRFGRYAEDDRFVIFASGVSNSLLQQQSEFERELSLLRDVIEGNPGKTLVYFSTCSIGDPAEQGRPYVQHKIATERFIAETAPSFHIFRLSNVVGHTRNPHTVLNFFVDAIMNGKPFDLWTSAHRNLIDIDHVYALIGHILEEGLFRNETTNIAHFHSPSVTAIISGIERYTGIRGRYTPVHRGGKTEIDLSKIEFLAPLLEIDLSGDPTHTLLTKYFPALAAFNPCPTQ
jgi:nucleoside-diphosphate-sugar epimerase